MSDNDINIRRDHEDTGGHGFKFPDEAAKDDVAEDTEGNSFHAHPSGSANLADAEGHGYKGSVSPEGEPADPKTGERPAPAAEEDTEGNGLRFHP